MDLVHDYFLQNCSLGEYHRMAFEDKSSLVQVSNGLVPSGSKPLHEPMLTQIYVTMTWRL